ncbi:unnamed protein product [Soboliphyme baturini]|uniref:Protein kinase domain-containing protein n=1 Tax=Soboliphyme baturini TaxID=241478 RepID=A0A183IPN8_9BILA|nr:unnamed protein product [Soboliphyme baturini]
MGRNRRSSSITMTRSSRSIETKDSGEQGYNANSHPDDKDSKTKDRWLLDPTAPNGKGTRKVRFDWRVTQKYDVLSVIGKGSFSIVMKVRNKQTNEYHSMKVISSGLSMIQNELSILSRVKHKYVVQLIEVFCTSSRVYVILELASGGELYDRITKKGTFTEDEAAYTVCMLLQGVSYLHSVGVTHRDLKPENLLYSSQEKNAKILITDFGLAHLQKPGEEDQMTDPCGTPEYIAPEILTRLPYTNKVDMWAVGVITYILLSGVMPFDDENRTALYRQILKGRYYFYPEFWSNVSEEAMQFVSTLLCVDADQRPTSEKALKHHWFASALGRTKNTDKRVGQTVRKSQSLSQYNPRVCYLPVGIYFPVGTNAAPITNQSCCDQTAVVRPVARRNARAGQGSQTPTVD